MNLLIATGAESTPTLRKANAKTMFVSCMVQFCVFGVRFNGCQGCAEE